MNRRHFVMGTAGVGLAHMIIPAVTRAKAPEMIEIKATDLPLSKHMLAYLNGEDVSSECTAIYARQECGLEALGWVEMFVYGHDENFNRITLTVDADSNIVTRRIPGLVKWEWKTA